MDIIICDENAKLLVKWTHTPDFLPRIGEKVLLEKKYYIVNELLYKMNFGISEVHITLRFWHD